MTCRARKWSGSSKHRPGDGKKAIQLQDGICPPPSGRPGHSGNCSRCTPHTRRPFSSQHMPAVLSIKPQGISPFNPSSSPFLQRINQGLRKDSASCPESSRTVGRSAAQQAAASPLWLPRTGWLGWVLVAEGKNCCVGKGTNCLLWEDLEVCSSPCW